MRFSDVKKPAVSREEAAMSPARARTLSGGAALKTLRAREEERDARAREEAPDPNTKEAERAASAELVAETPAAPPAETPIGLTTAAPAAAPAREGGAAGLGKAALAEVLRPARRRGK